MHIKVVQLTYWTGSFFKMWELINSFPRQIAYPDRKVVHNKEEFLNFLNRYNAKKKKIYFSIYNCNDEGKFNGWSDIDVIGFDLDSDNKIKCLKTLHEYCKINNYRHLMIFSTNGFWLFIKTKNGKELKFPKDALYNTQLHIINENGLTAYERNESGEIDPHINDVDFHILGDIARISRCPLSYDVDRKRYCIPITENDLNKGFDYICKKSKKPVYNFVWYGTDAINIKDFDFVSESRTVTAEIPDGNYEYENMEKGLIKGIFPCVHEWITKREKAVWKARYYTVIWLHEMGYPKSFAYNLLKRYYSHYPRTDGYRTNWEHMDRTRVIDYVYNGGKDVFFPTCEKIWEEGLCPGKCNYFNTIYKWEGNND